MFRMKAFVSMLLAALLLLGCASAAPLLAGQTWEGGEDYGEVSQYTMHINETWPEGFRFDFTQYRIHRLSDCYAYTDEYGTFFTSYGLDGMAELGGEVIYFNDPNALALRFDWCVPGELEELLNQTILLTRS